MCECYVHFQSGIAIKRRQLNMLIDINNFVEKINSELNKKDGKWVDYIDLEKYRIRNQYTVKYGKDESFILYGKDMFSYGILRHIDANKCLFSALHRQMPKKSRNEEYTAFYYDDEHLVMSEFKMPGYGSRITFYLCGENEKNQIAVFIMNNERNLPKVYFSTFEHSIFDDENRIVSNEFYENQSSDPYGVTASAEYYEYDGTVLTNAIKYENYNKNFKPHSALKEICPTLIINPCIYEYAFEYSNNSVFCEKKHRYSQTENVIKKYELKNVELLKLLKNGVDCFGVNIM